jgi:hypothetical protein
MICFEDDDFQSEKLFVLKKKYTNEPAKSRTAATEFFDHCLRKIL